MTPQTPKEADLDAELYDIRVQILTELTLGASIRTPYRSANTTCTETMRPESS